MDRNRLDSYLTRGDRDFPPEQSTRDIIGLSNEQILERFTARANDFDVCIEGMEIVEDDGDIIVTAADRILLHWERSFLMVLVPHVSIDSGYPGGWGIDFEELD